MFPADGKVLTGKIFLLKRGFVSFQLLLTKNHLSPGPSFHVMNHTFLPTCGKRPASPSPTCCHLPCPSRMLSRPHNFREHCTPALTTERHELNAGGPLLQTTGSFTPPLSGGTCANPAGSPCKHSASVTHQCPPSAPAFVVVAVLTNIAAPTALKSMPPKTCLPSSLSRDLTCFLRMNFSPKKPQSVLPKEYSTRRNPKLVEPSKNQHPLLSQASQSSLGIADILFAAPP